MLTMKKKKQYKLHFFAGLAFKYLIVSYQHLWTMSMV